MNEPTESPSATESDVKIARERTKQASIVGWTGGLSVFFAAGALASVPTWPVASAVMALAVMVGIICYAILKR